MSPGPAGHVVRLGGGSRPPSADRVCSLLSVRPPSSLSAAAADGEGVSVPPGRSIRRLQEALIYRPDRPLWREAC